MKFKKIKLGVVTGELATRVQKFADDKEKLSEEHRQARLKLDAFIKSFTTYKKLRDNWPEGAKFYDKFDIERATPNVPAIITSEINTMLGLTAGAKGGGKK